MNNEILKEVDNIVSFIKESDDYKEYLFLKDKLSKNKKALSLINDIKTLQKEIVKKEIKKDNILRLEEEINKKILELNKIPLYVDYIRIQEKLDELFQYIKEKLNDYFEERIN